MGGPGGGRRRYAARQRVELLDGEQHADGPVRVRLVPPARQDGRVQRPRRRVLVVREPGCRDVLLRLSGEHRGLVRAEGRAGRGGAEPPWSIIVHSAARRRGCVGRDDGPRRGHERLCGLRAVLERAPRCARAAPRCERPQPRQGERGRGRQRDGHGGDPAGAALRGRVRRRDVARRADGAELGDEHAVDLARGVADDDDDAGCAGWCGKWKAEQEQGLGRAERGVRLVAARRALHHRVVLEQRCGGAAGVDDALAAGRVAAAVEAVQVPEAGVHEVVQAGERAQVPHDARAVQLQPAAGARVAAGPVGARGGAALKAVLLPGRAVPAEV